MHSLLDKVVADSDGLTQEQIDSVKSRFQAEFDRYRKSFESPLNAYTALPLDQACLQDLILIYL